MDSTAAQATPPTSGRRRGSIVGPVFLILLGVLFLGQTLGWFSPTLWATLLSYWPVLLILLGVELILGRGSWVGALVLGVVIVGIVGAFAVVGALPWSSGTIGIGQFTPVETMSVSEEIGQTRQTSYQLEFGAGSLDLSALASGSGSLFEGTLERDERAAIDKSVVRQGEMTQVTIKGRNAEPVRWGVTTGRTRMTLKLSPTTPSRINVNGGAGDLNLDLSSVPVAYFELNAGVGGSKVVLPRSAGKTTASVNVGVGGVDITIPEGVAAQITVDKGIGGIDIDESRFPKVGDNTYRSPNYDTATNSVALDVSGGIGGTAIK